MMMPATAFSSSSSSSSSSASVNVRVDKATSEFLNVPDWTLNIDICDTINSNHWLAKDVVKAVKKRLQHKSPNVQMLSLTLLETMVKNCGDHVHFQIAERNILPEMIKIVKKKTDMRVREKILVLLDSWQEAFGGRGGKYPQYYFAYEELRHSGVEFPRRSPDASPIFTPPITVPPFGPPQPGYGMPSNSSTRLDEAMASEIENLSLPMIESMRNVSDLLSEMLQAVDPKDRDAVKDEVIVDVVDRCHLNQKKLVQMLASTSDEELLGQGLELNDILQSVLAKHEAIASGSPIADQVQRSMTQPANVEGSHSKSSENEKVNLKSSAIASAPVGSSSRNEAEQKDEDEDEEEDDFALLARRHSKTQPTPSQNVTAVTAANTTTTDTASDPSLTMALTITDPPPPPVNTTRAEDMIDFLSLTLSSATATSPHSPPPVTTAQAPPEVPAATHHHQQPPPSNSYVVPWAQAQPQPEPQVQFQPQSLPTGYIPPPWAATPGYNNSNPYSYPYLDPRATSYYNNSPATSGGVAASGADGRKSSNSGVGGQKPFIPSYRLFEDLDVLGNSRTSTTPFNLPGGSAGQSMNGGKK